MAVVQIDVALFRKMVINGAINLKNHKAEVDAFNVFPVPDGDTGTNMSMTVTSGIRELETCESSSIIDNAKVLSRGALMGARGNSGVILSQFFRGLYVGLKEIQHNYLDIHDLMNCLKSGCKVAYKAVMEPVEGTILTVVREAAENTEANIDKFSSVDELLDFYYAEACKSLERTPELLPVLKEAGVVDSGGAGFCKVVEGMALALKGKILSVESEVQEEKKEKKIETKYIYVTELKIDLKKPDSFDVKELIAPLSLLGEYVKVEKVDNHAFVSVNTDRPGRVIEICQKQGEFVTFKIENIKKQSAEEVKETPKAALPDKESALIAVCFGSGIVQTFKEMGVDYVIEGGQTMNPSTESFVEAIKAVNAKNVIVIPNNGNVVMAAKQAAGLVNNVNVAVLPAKTIAQGYVSLINYNPEASLDENVSAMTEQIEHVKSGEITYSIRDTEIKGVKINSGDFMGIADGEIVVSTAKKSDALSGLLEKIVEDDSEIVTFFVGADVTDEEKQLVEDVCLNINSNLDVEIIDGNQDIYSYIIAVE